MSNIEQLLGELYELKDEVTGEECSCHINPPCSYCISTGNVAECVERITAFVNRDKYLRYLKNVGGNIGIRRFDEDWEPIGYMIRRTMLGNGEAVEQEGSIMFNYELAEILGLD